MRQRRLHQYRRHRATVQYRPGGLGSRRAGLHLHHRRLRREQLVRRRCRRRARWPAGRAWPAWPSVARLRLPRGRNFGRHTSRPAPDRGDHGRRPRHGDERGDGRNRAAAGHGPDPARAQAALRAQPARRRRRDGAFHATDDHPWRVHGRGWVHTVDLRPGDRIDTASDDDLVVTALTLTTRVELTYNLTVEEWHTLLIGDDRAVVHNVDCNKLRHIFRDAHPNALALAERLGSQEAAFNAVQGAMQRIATQEGISGVVTRQITVSGITITARGNVVGGIFRVGTFW